MERNHDDLIDLGTASVATMGPGGEPADDYSGQNRTGLSDD